jgi:hypothetical protein
MGLAISGINRAAESNDSRKLGFRHTGFLETQRPEGIERERAKTAHEEVASYKREMGLQD